MAFFDRGYALVVSVANYRNLPPLPQSVLHDATDLSATLADPAYGGYRPERVRRLVDDEATAAGIRAGLDWLAGQTGRYDTVLIFFTGHGGRLESGPQTGEYFLPVDAEPADLAQTAIGGAELAGLLGSIKAVRLVVVFDCGRSGEDIRRRLQEALPGFKPGLAESYYGRLAVTQGRVVLAASRPDEMSWDLPETRNSLFGHCLLQGLQGQVRTHDDGLIRIFDLFKFTAQEVTGRQPRQQPLMAAEVDTNFPMALYRGGARFIDHPGRPSPSLHVSFPPQASAVLTMMFPENRRLMVERELAGDAKGGQLFLIRPLQQGEGQEPVAAVKLAAAPLIEQEWRAYRRYFHQHLPGSAAVTRLVLVPGSGWGGLRYHLGQGEKPAVETYLSYCQHASPDEVLSTLQDRVLKILGRLVQPSRTTLSFSLQHSYDGILPVNLLVKPAAVPDGAAGHIVRPNRLPEQPLRRGDYVRLQGFTVTGQDRLHQAVVLDGRPPSFAVALEVDEPAAYHIHQVIDEIEGMVIETRHERLQAEFQAALGTNIDLNAPDLPGPGGALPNPLADLAVLLQQRPAVKIGCIHGDMAMDKIFIDPGSGDISLIDFAAVREDHVLHDYLRLETDVVTRIIPDILAADRAEVWSVCSFLRQVHQSLVNKVPPAVEQLALPALEKPLLMLMAIRQAAQPYLLAADNWAEYYQGLMFYLLGACGAQNRREPGVAPTPLARQVAFWAAATVRVLLLESEVSPSSK